MPSIRNFEDSRIVVVTKLGGIRRIPLLRWIPFITGQIPKIVLVIKAKDTKYKIEQITIECDAPKHRDDTLFERDYWLSRSARRFCFL